jgi:hypothetical protein
VCKYINNIIYYYIIIVHNVVIIRKRRFSLYKIHSLCETKNQANLFGLPSPITIVYYYLLILYVGQQRTNERHDNITHKARTHADYCIYV